MQVGYPDAAINKLEKGTDKTIQKFGHDGKLYWADFVKIYEASYTKDKRALKSEFERRGFRLHTQELRRNTTPRASQRRTFSGVGKNMPPVMRTQSILGKEGGVPGLDTPRNKYKPSPPEKRVPGPNVRAKETKPKVVKAKSPKRTPSVTNVTKDESVKKSKPKKVVEPGSPAAAAAKTSPKKKPESSSGGKAVYKAPEKKEQPPP